MIRTISIFLFVFSLAACTKNVDVSPSNREIGATLELLLEETMENSYGNIPGIAMAVMSPSLSDGIWTGASGYDSRKKDNELSNEQPFRIASVTKTFVAISILRLHEMDSISIDDPIGKYISQVHLDILKKDNYDISKILIRHCLNHTSGLFDYAANHDAYIDACIQDPSHRWTRTEQIEGAIRWGDKVGEPGELYKYSDTGYILLGEIIESFFQGDLAQGLRTLLKFDQLGLKETWLETLEPAPQNLSDPVHRYLGRLDATEFDASIDLYGGGGLMSTCQDLAMFINALFNDRIFDKQETLALMKTEPTYFSSYNPEDDSRYKDYRYGLWQFSIYGEEAFMHGGLWGTMLIHVPSLDMSIATNFTVGQNDRLLKKTILAIKNIQSSKSN